MLYPIIIIIIGLIIILCCYIYSQKILVAICCIDEREKELSNCVKHLKKSNILKKDILGLFRKKDILCKKIVDNYLEVNDYELSNNTRHNLSGLANKRNKALEYARNNNYDKLIFIDSDIEVKWHTILYLLLGTMIADISCVAYPIRWASMKPVLGFDNPPSIQPISYGILPFQKCSVAGMGCTCIDIKSSKIPDKFIQGEMLGISGEDIGFFLEARKKQAVVVASKWHIVNHKF